MEKYQDYLRVNILDNAKIITYRLLSRELKVHVHIAKQMLHEFYTTNNSSNPSSPVHANYLLTGLRPPPPPPQSEDTIMQSSPFDPSQVEPDLMKAIVVVPEEKLESAKKGFLVLRSVHVYSLEPNRLPDMSILAGVAQEVLKEYNGLDGKVFGTIANPSAVKRGKTAPPAAATAPRAVKEEWKPSVKPAAKAEKPAAKATIKKEGSDVKEEKPAITKIEKKAGKQTQGGFFASWNKGAQKQKDKKAAAGSNTTSAAQSPAEDNATKLETDSEDGGDEDESPAAIHDNEETIRKRKAKDEDLKNMMDMDDEDEKMEDEQPIPSKKSTPTPPPPAVQDSEPGKPKRGHRLVKKRVSVKDDDGYLVTRMEKVWESYSESEEPPPAKPKPKPVLVAPKAKGKGGKAGGQQGNIMSFFAKK